MRQFVSLTAAMAALLVLAAGLPAATAHADPVTAAAVDEGATFVPMAPLRVLDTRVGTGTGGLSGPVAGAPCVNPDTGCRSAVPVQVTGLTDVLAVSAAANTTFALRSDGSMWAWGRNGGTGNLGNGTSGACPSLPLPPDCRSTAPVRATLPPSPNVSGGGFGVFAVTEG